MPRPPALLGRRKVQMGQMRGGETDRSFSSFCALVDGDTTLAPGESMTFDITDGDGEGKEDDILQAISSGTDEWERMRWVRGGSPPQ
jgi:hypothetical protein